MPTQHQLDRLATLLAALLLALLVSQQPSSAASSTSQQHQNKLTTKRAQQLEASCSRAGEANTLRIRKDGFTIKDVWATLDQKDYYSMLNCPVTSSVVINHNCTQDPEVTELANQIRSNLTVCAWYKEGALMHRENANPVLTQYDSPNSRALLQVTPSDEGIYTCTLNYSKVLLINSELANQCLVLYPSVKFKILVDDLSHDPPDTAPSITHPPYPMKSLPGQNVTFTCHSTTTLLSARTDWFRSNCNASQTEHYDECMRQFFEAYRKTLEERHEQQLAYMRPYFIPNEDGETLIINNLDENDVDTYGCMVSNKLGLDIRTANLTLDYVFNGTQVYHPSLPIAPKVSPIQQYDYHNEVWVTAIFVVAFILLAFLFCIYILLFTKLGLKLSKASPLLKHMVAEEASKDDSDNRQHLPKVESPDIYNIGKSEECYIYGHFHQKGGNLMAQSMCSPTLTRGKNLSISSNNYHSDESASWTKSLSSSGDNSRALYQHTSNNTATTVPLYDHPPSTGTALPTGALVLGSCVINPTYGFLRPDFDATSSRLTFSRRNLEPQQIIGKGQFGEVWRYVAHQKDGKESFVAVKKLTVRGGQEHLAKDEILKEIEIMKRVNDHPNVIKFLNTCVEPTTVLLIMEYADNGTLQAYLRKCRYAKDRNDASVTSKELLKYSYHVAKGMEYIASKGIVHRDLATRNILLSKEKVCKIADFGLARFVGDRGIYQRLDRNQPVPIKWMAPESLTEFGTYTTKSDVFSVGVLMWEVVTLGATPYDFLPSSEVLKKVINGGRLSRPEHCREEFYKIMERCWHQDPVKRPTFKELADELEVLLQSENDYIQLDKYPEHAYYNINTSENAEKEMVASLTIYPELDNVFDPSRTQSLYN